MQTLWDQGSYDLGDPWGVVSLVAKSIYFSLNFSKLSIEPVDFTYGDWFCVHSVEVLRFEPTKVCKPEGRKRHPETGKKVYVQWF